MGRIFFLLFWLVGWLVAWVVKLLIFDWMETVERHNPRPTQTATNRPKQMGKTYVFLPFFRFLTYQVLFFVGFGAVFGFFPTQQGLRIANTLFFCWLID